MRDKTASLAECQELQEKILDYENHDTLEISTVLFICSHYYNVAKVDKPTFIDTIFSYDFSLTELKNARSQFCNHAWKDTNAHTPDKSSCTRKNVIESIFRQFDKYGHHEVEYFPHPKDSSILIDSSPAKRQLNTLETQLKSIANSPSINHSEPRHKPSTYAQASKSKPKVIVGTATVPGKSQPVLEPVKTIAVKVTVNASTTKENIERQLFTESNVFSKLKLNTKVEELYSDKRTANFRVSCTTWPVHKSFLEPEIWPTGAEIRPWYGPIQDLSKCCLLYTSPSPRD